MYIGSLQHLASISFYHACTDIAFPPDSRDGELYVWSWQSVYDTALDVRLSLTQKCFVGSVTLALSPSSGIRKALIFADGKPAGQYSAETGKDATGTLTIPVGLEASALTLRLSGNLKDIVFPMPDIEGAYEDGNPFLWPTPANADFGDGMISLKEVICAHADNADEQVAAQFLRERLTERFGAWESADGVTVTVTLDNSGDFANERFRVAVEKNAVTLTAGARLPLHYAADALLQLGENARFRVSIIDDHPYKPMRGFHMMLPPVNQLEFTKRVFRYILIPLRYNQLIVEFAGGMRFDRHPEISDAWIEGNKRGEAGLQPKFPHGTVAGGRCLEKAQVRDLLDNARDYGFEIIPEVQSFGHVQYITYAHPEIAEREEKDNTVKDTRGEDARPSEFYAHCYCPSLDESFAIIYDIIDEILEVARPQHYVHMGHDEIYQVGVCPRCKGKDPAELYIKHVTAMHDYLAKRGLKMMIWADMLHHTERYKTWPAITKLPRDIIMLDFIWYFHFDLDMEDHLLPHGYQVVMGNLYSSHYPRYETRAAKENMIGGQVSTWCLFDEYTLAKKGKFWDLQYTAEMLWNPRYSLRLREVYTNLITKYIQKPEREELRGTYRPAGYEKINLPMPSGCSCGIPSAVKALRPASVLADGMNCTINGRFDRLVFEQTTVTNAPRISWDDLKVLGEYIIHYADGSEEKAPVRYAGNILSWNRRYAQPLPQQYYRHQGYIGTWYADPAAVGKTDSGEDVLICGYVWENPHSEREIVNVEFVAQEGSIAPVVLCGIYGENAK